MYLQDFLGEPEAVLDAAFTTPKLNPKKNPTIEVALRVVGDMVAKGAQERMAEEIRIDLMDAVVMYEITNGEHEDAERKDDYESGMDDAVEAALEKYDDHLSADWLGKNTIDTQVWLSSETDRTIVEALAKNAAKEVFKQITFDKTPSQILSNAGITRDDIEARLEQPETAGEPIMADDLDGVIAKIKAHVGANFDQMAVYEDLETIVEEDDDILAGSAASRLGLKDADMEALQLAALDLDDAPSELCEMVANYKAPSKASKAKAEKAAKAEAKTAAEENAVDKIVLVNLKECGAPDTATAEALGISRSTYTNYIKGKTPFAPSEEQYAVIREQLVERANLMLSALAELDGTELVEVA